MTTVLTYSNVVSKIIEGNPDPYFSSVVLLAGFNGADGATAATDEATGKAMTFVGNAQLDTAQAKFGSASLLLDGTGDYLTLADHADWSIGTNQFTIEAWVRPSALPSTNAILSQAGTSSTRSFYFYLNALTLNFAYSTSGVSVGTVTSPGLSIAVNNWYHVAVDRDATGTVRLYLDGVKVGSGSFTGSFFSSASALGVGVLEYSPWYFSGWLDEVRFTNGVARYASDSGYAVPLSAFPRS